MTYFEVNIMLVTCKRHIHPKLEILQKTLRFLRAFKTKAVSNTDKNTFHHPEIVNVNHYFIDCPI